MFSCAVYTISVSLLYYIFIYSPLFCIHNCILIGGHPHFFASRDFALKSWETVPLTVAIVSPATSLDTRGPEEPGSWDRGQSWGDPASDWPPATAEDTPGWPLQDKGQGKTQHQTDLQLQRRILQADLYRTRVKVSPSTLPTLVV